MYSFQPHVRTELIRFSEHLASLDEDYIILMARKALRLYELLIRTGSSSSNKIVLSQRVLDEKLDWVEGKRVAVVDDTLIVGTTIKDAIDTLISAGAAKINTYVFCCNEDYWVKELVQPKKIFMRLSDREMMSFCASEVIEFERNGIPYISDFPISEQIKIDNINTLNLIPNWRAYQITTKKQEKEGRHVITFLPDGDLYSEIEEKLGVVFYSLVDIVKVRAIGKIEKGIYEFRLIPIFTFKPLRKVDLDSLFREVIESLNTGHKLDNVFNRIISSKGKLRCIQYIFSVVFGRVFMENFGYVTKSRQSITFVESEIFRNYGPWLLDEFRIITTSAKKKIWNKNNLIIKNIQPAEYPSLVQNIVNEEDLLVALEGENNCKNIITDVSRLFIKLHNEHEIPARKEAKEFATKGDYSYKNSKHRNRLKVGYPWQLIVEYLCKIYGKNITVKYSNLFSLVLDFWNDKGVSVPIICEMDGVVFRAYRHGESAPYSNQEAGLCWILLQSYFETRKIDVISHTDLLKILAILFRSGMKNDFIDIITGSTGSSGVARIGYHLHGAIPFVTEDQNNLYADNKDNWITSYLVSQKILVRIKKGKFNLGQLPSANFYKPESEANAKDLGLFLGYLMDNRNGSGESFLTTQGLIKIATCSDLSSTIAAINAELRIITKSYNTTFRNSLTSIDFNSLSNIKENLTALRRSELYTALHSAKMKILAYENREVKTIIENCKVHFKKQRLGAAQARTWGRLMSFCELDDSKESTKKLIPTYYTQANQIIFFCAVIYTIEYSLANLLRKDNLANFKKISNSLQKKVTDIQQEFENFGFELKIIRKLQSEMSVAASDKFFDSEKSIRWAIGKIQSRIGEIQDQVFISNRILTDHNANIEPRTYFDHVLWYDIVDSTGTKAAELMSPDGFREYKSSVSRFRDSINRRLTTICEEYSVNGNEVLPWNGTVESKNDEKHIFFTGDDRNMATIKTIAALLNIAKQCSGVCFRAVFIPCDFTGDSYASSSKSSVEVEGEVFLTHFDRLKRQIRIEEKKLVSSHIRIFISEQFRSNFYKELKKIGMYGEREFSITTTEGLRNNTVKLIGANIKI